MTDILEKPGDGSMQEEEEANQGFLGWAPDCIMISDK